MTRRRPIEDRFFERISPEPNSGCWLWLGQCDSKGYGRISLGGRHGGNTGAHRLSLKIAGVDVPDDMLVCHHCDVPSCVNPDHLFIGTQHDNLVDMVSKGRHVSNGEQLRGKRRNGRVWNSEKTHCKHGHPLNGDNLSIAANGWRRCRACWRMRRTKAITRDRAGRLSLRRMTDEAG